MLLPLLLAALPAQVDATVTLAPTATVVTGTNGSTHYTMVLAAAEASSWMRLVQPRSSFSLDMSGRYGQALVATGMKSPPRDLFARGRGRLDIVSSPRTNLVFLSDGFVASRIGLRATDELAVRDPFSVNRVLDGWSAQSSLFGRINARAFVHFDVRYGQAGAIAADLPAAVGIDTHAVTISAATAFQWSRRLSAGPTTRMNWTHFNHALVATDLTRGSADVTTLSLLGFTRYDFTPRTRTSVVAGLTMASAQPGAKDVRTIVYPDARFEIRSVGRRVGGTAAFSFAYQSLGPRIGFGTDYSGLIDAWIRPFRGGQRRDVLAHAVMRARWARALLPAGDSSSQTNMGRLTTTALACGFSLTGPMRLGWSVNAGVDVEFVTTHIDPAPSRGDPPESFRALFTVALLASASPDRGRLLPRDPLVPLYDDRLAAPFRAVRRKDSRDALADEDPSDIEDEE